MNQDTQTHCNSVARKGKHITFSERQQIERWLREKKSLSQIAKLLDRHRSAIYREVERGTVCNSSTISPYTAPPPPNSLRIEGTSR